MSELQFSRLSPDDIEEVAALEKETFGHEAWTRKDFIEVLDLPYAYYLIARIDGELAGCCGLRNMCGDGDITNVMVPLRHRRKGIGESMLSELMLRTLPLGVRAFTLEVRSRNYPAISLYEKLGFSQEGLRRGFYEEPADDALIFWKRQGPPL